ncbi:hypothetical protein [Bdellovibrio sp. HCB337]|uniref:hypothetical protein n=1 Tax=Bdellovibrio sp. HCB337 TaxID=3394358 RepID=UPI0039A590FF
MKTLKHWIIAGIFTTTSVSFGAGATESGVVGFGSASTVPLKSPEQKTQEAVAASSSGKGITDNAKKTKDSNKAGQMLNTVIGAANIAFGTACLSACSSGGCDCATGAMFLMMGMQNMAQAGSQGKTSGQAGGTYGMTDTGLGTTGYDPNAALQNDPEVKKGLDFMESLAQGKPINGVTYDPKTGNLTTADGKTIKGKDVSSPAAMEAAGVSKSVIDSISAMEKKFEAKAKAKVDKLMSVAVNGEEGSAGGGGGGGSAITSGSGSEAAAGYAAAGSGLGVDRDPAQVAGMQKNYNGEPIGVAGDSIFKMMNRRYKTKENQNTFLDESALLQK